MSKLNHVTITAAGDDLPEMSFDFPDVGDGSVAITFDFDINGAPTVCEDGGQRRSFRIDDSAYGSARDLGIMARERLVSVRQFIREAAGLLHARGVQRNLTDVNITASGDDWPSISLDVPDTGGGHAGITIDFDLNGVPTFREDGGQWRDELPNDGSAAGSARALGIQAQNLLTEVQRLGEDTLTCLALVDRPAPRT